MYWRWHWTPLCKVSRRRLPNSILYPCVIDAFAIAGVDNPTTAMPSLTFDDVAKAVR
jgi:hypothetical protein